MKKLIIVVSSFLVVACVTGYTPRYIYSEIQVVNLSGATINDVQVRIGGSGRTLNCERVDDNRICYDSFGRRPFPQQGIDLSWTHGDGSQKSQQLTPKFPIYLSGPTPLGLLLHIDETGSVDIRFRQYDLID